MTKAKQEPITEEIRMLLHKEELEELRDQFDACSHGRRLRCDECSTRDWDSGRKDGFENGFNYVINQIKERAGAAFVRDATSEAELLRRVAKEIVALAENNKLIQKQ